MCIQQATSIDAAATSNAAPTIQLERTRFRALESHRTPAGEGSPRGANDECRRDKVDNLLPRPRSPDHNQDQRISDRQFDQIALLVVRGRGRPASRLALVADRP